MALRFIYVGMALAMLTATGCKTTTSNRPPCPPAVVATTPVAPAPACPAPIPVAPLQPAPVPIAR